MTQKHAKPIWAWNSTGFYYRFSRYSCRNSSS